MTWTSSTGGGLFLERDAYLSLVPLCKARCSAPVVLVFGCVLQSPGYDRWAPGSAYQRPSRACWGFRLKNRCGSDSWPNGLIIDGSFYLDVFKLTVWLWLKADKSIFYDVTCDGKVYGRLSCVSQKGD